MGEDPGPGGPLRGPGDDVVRELRRAAAATPRSGRHRGLGAAPTPPAARTTRAVRVTAVVAGLAVAVTAGVLLLPDRSPAPVGPSPVAPPVESASLPPPSESVAAAPPVESVAAAASVAAREPSWPVVLAGLDAARLAVWRSGDEAALGAADVAGSDAERADLEVLRSLRAEGLVPGEVLTEVREVRVLDRAPGRVELFVVDRRSAYALRTREGRVVRRVPARGERAWRVVLVAVPGGAGRWLTERVTPASGP